MQKPSAIALVLASTLSVSACLQSTIAAPSVRQLHAPSLDGPSRPKSAADQARMLLKIANTYNQNDDTAQAIVAYTKAIALAKSAGRGQSRLLEEALLKFADFYYYRQLFPSALELLSEAQRLRPLDRQHSIMLGQCLYVGDKHEQALSVFRNVLEEDEQISTGEHAQISAGGLSYERRRLATLYLRHGQPAKASEIYDKAIAQLSNGADRSKKVSALRLDLAFAYDQAKKYKEASAIYKQELQSAETALGPLAPATTALRMDLALSLHHDGHSLAAADLYTDLLKKYKDTPDYANVLSHQASYFWQVGRINEAADALRDSIAAYSKGPAPPATRTKISKLNLHTVLVQQGKLAEAEKLHKEIVALSNPSSDTDNFVLMWESIDAGKTDKAIELGKKYVAAARKDDPYDKARRLKDLAHIYCDAGMLSKAEALLKQKFELEQKTLPTGGDPMDLAKLYAKTGRFGEAEKLFSSQIALLRRPGGIAAASAARRPQSVADAQNEFAQFYFEQGKYAKAAAVLSQALKEFPNKHRLQYIAVLNGNLALALAKQGRLANSAQVLEKVLKTQLNDSTTSCLSDPVSGFNSTGCEFSSAGTIEGEYLTATGEARIEPSLSESLHERPVVATQRKPACLLEGHYGNCLSEPRLPMVEWDQPTASEGFGSLRSMTRLALFNIYNQMHEPEKANAQRSELLKEVRRAIGTNIHGQSEYYNEKVIARLPQDGTTIKVALDLKEQRLKRAHDSD